jgi:hypothetical protein
MQRANDWIKTWDQIVTAVRREYQRLPDRAQRHAEFHEAGARTFTVRTVPSPGVSVTVSIRTDGLAISFVTQQFIAQTETWGDDEKHEFEIEVADDGSCRFRDAKGNLVGNAIDLARDLLQPISKALTRISRAALWVAAVIYSVGFFTAYLLGPILVRFNP